MPDRPIVPDIWSVRVYESDPEPASVIVPDPEAAVDHDSLLVPEATTDPDPVSV